MPKIPPPLPIPAWLDGSYRELKYPANEWYCSFVEAPLEKNADVGCDLKNLELEARKQLSENIIVNISSNSYLSNASRSVESGNESSETIYREYFDEIRSTSSATIVKTDIQTWHDAKGRRIYAFACVKRKDLINYYNNKVGMELERGELMLQNVELLASVGKKVTAKEKCFELNQNLKKIDPLFDLLIAVNDTPISESKLQERFKQLKGKVSEQLLALEHSICVYIKSEYRLSGDENDAFSSDPLLLKKILEQILSDNGCSIVSSADNADFQLELITSTSLRSKLAPNGFGVLSYYADVEGELININTRKSVSSFSFYKDPDLYSAGSSAKDAATRAFKKEALRNKIIEKILPIIIN